MLTPTATLSRVVAPRDASMTSAVPSDLARERRLLASTTLAQLFARDPGRFSRLSFEWDGWLFDFSKERLGGDTLPLLVDHAIESGLAGWIAALFAGEKVNQSERRPALYTALRQGDDTPLLIDGRNVIADIRVAQGKMRGLVAQIRGGLRVGATGQPIRAVVNIGIGGSDLGAHLVCSALAGPPRARGGTGAQTDGVDVSFVSNADPEHLTRALAPLDPATTLFLLTSKSFTTQETLANATGAKAWLGAALGAGVNVNAHFIATTANAAAAKSFGIAAGDIFPWWDWVGGRYCLWSPAGLPIALELGFERFEKLLAGASSVDAHFRETPFERNLPVLLGLVGWWNAAHLKHVERVVVPYSQALGLLPSYLQQLVLESHGKRVARDGTLLAEDHSPAVWGEVGSNSQHSFFQWLHQGPREAPVEFIVPIAATHPVGEQQMLLVANALASASALMIGRGADDIRTELAAQSISGADLDAAVAARVCPGDRASTTILMPELSPFRLGQLLALYEHRTFVEGMLYCLNPFDEFGVEYGKTLAGPIAASLSAGEGLPPDTDASTRGLVSYVRSRRVGEAQRAAVNGAR
jgi:glucose-6-phosphate isomerase